MENKYQEVDHKILQYLDQVEIISLKDRLGDDVWHFDIYSRELDVRGTGTDQIEEVAFLKAQNELIERMVYIFSKENNKEINSSSGFACHLTVEQAIESSYCELLERDLFLTSWFAGKSPDWNITASDKIIDKSFVCNQVKLFRSFDLKLDLALVGICDNRYCTLAALRDVESRFGFVLATSVDQDIDLAIKKVILDQRRVATYLINSFEQREDFYQERFEFKKPIDQQKFYLHPSRSNNTSSYFDHSQEAINISKFSKSFIEYKLPEPINSSVSIVQCVSNDCQNYFIGDEPTGNLNNERIAEIGKFCTSRMIHPLG